MSVTTILVHDPYDVFLAIGFGCCYASALTPAVRMISRHKDALAATAGSATTSPNFWTKAFWRPCAIRGTVVARGVFTIVGLGCLYVWYSIYFKNVFPEQLPLKRQLLDWLSLALFGIGAHYWDNEDHQELLYCTIQIAALVAFAVTCYWAIPTNPDGHHGPLLKAVFWCVIVTGSLLYHGVYSMLVKRLFDSKRWADRKASVICGIIGFAILAMFAGMAWVIFRYWLRIANYLGAELGVWSYILAGAIYLVITLTTICTETKVNQQRVRTIIVTIVPMVVLVVLTWRNETILFQHN